MKKKVVALCLSIVIAVSSIGGAPVMAAETAAGAASEAATVSVEGAPHQEPSDEDDDQLMSSEESHEGAYEQQGTEEGNAAEDTEGPASEADDDETASAADDDEPQSAADDDENASADDTDGETLSEDDVEELSDLDSEADSEETDNEDADSTSEDMFTTEDGWTYKIEDDHATIIFYEGSESVLTVPEELDGMPVTTIDGDTNKNGQVFNQNTTVTELIIPPSVKVITPYSLDKCAIKSITFNTNLDPITDDREVIPQSVTRIILGKEAETLQFYDYDGYSRWIDGDYLQEYVVDEDNPYYTAFDGVLFNKDMTKLIRYPKDKKGNVYTIPDGVEEIGTMAFNGTINLLELHIPGSVNAFGDDALGAQGDYSGATNNRFIVFAPEGSAAEIYASSLGIAIGTENSEIDVKKNGATRTVESLNGVSRWNGTDSQEIVPVGKDYTISSAAELKWISDQVAAGKNFKGNNIILTTDIDLNGKPWVPIGSNNTPFCGSFDGQGHTISNLSLDGSAEKTGLFGLIRAAQLSSITIRSLKIKNVSKTAKGGGNTGALAGSVYAARGSNVNISDISVTGSLAGSSAGGAIGELWCGHNGSNVTVDGVNSTVSIMSGGAGVIGIIDMKDYNYEGAFDGSVTVRNCKYEGDVHGGSGIVGSLANSSSDKRMRIEHCRAIAQGNNFSTGGIIADLPAYQTIKSCVVYGNVSGYNAGGITCTNRGTVEECYFEGNTYAQTGGNNGALVCFNEGLIYNSYNGGQAPNSSALCYNGSIASCGSGTVENSYNIGNTAKEVSTGVAVSHPGVFGYTSGQTLINSYYDNTFNDYIFGNVKETGIITDGKITASGGMSTALMKTSGSYIGWDFTDIWEFDRQYSWGYPTLRSIKDLLRKHPDTNTKNTLKKTQFTFNVVNGASQPIENAVILLGEGTSDEIALTTDELGKANTACRDGVLGIRITKEGFATYEDAGFAMNAKHEITLVLFDKDNAAFAPLKSVIMEQTTKTNMGKVSNLRYELLSQSKTINRQWSLIEEIGDFIPRMTYLPFTLRAALVDPEIHYVKAELVQDLNGETKVIAVAGDPSAPVFSDIKYDMFEVSRNYLFNSKKIQNEIMIRMTDEAGNEVTQAINLTVEDEAEQSFDITFDSGLSVTIPSSIPVLGNTKIEVPIAKAPLYITVDDKSLEVGIRKNGAFKSKTEEIEFKNFFKNLKKVSKQKLKDSASLKKQCEEFVKNWGDKDARQKDMGVGPFKFTWDVLGYLEVEFPWEKKVSGNLIISFSLKAGGEAQYWIFVVGLEGKGTVTGTSSLDINFEKADILSAKLPTLENFNLGISGLIGFGAFVGAGLVNTLSAGVYGDAAMGVDVNLVDSELEKPALDKMYLQGALSLVARWMGSNAIEKTIWSGTYPIYDRENVDDPESQGTYNSMMMALEDMSESEVIESTEEPAGEWSGTGETLQEDAYSGSAPRVISVDGTRVMLFTTNSDTSRAAADRSMLVYSIYDPENNSWNTPVPVYDDGTADFNPSASGKYVVWNNAKRSLSGITTYSELGKQTDVCIAEFDAQSGKFTNVQTVTDDDRFENRLMVSGENDPVITWTTDSEDSIIGLGSTNTFYSAEYKNGSWAVSGGYDENNLIVSKDTGVLDGKQYIFYIADEDRDLATTEDQKLYAERDGETTLLSDSTVLQAAYAQNAKKLLFIDDMGNICSLTSLTDDPVEETTDGRAAGAIISQVVDDTDGNITLITIKADGNSRSPYIMRYISADAAWTNPVILKEQGDYIESMAAWYEGDELVYVYNRRIVQLSGENNEFSETNSILWSKNSTNSVSLKITDVFFYPDLLTVGEDFPITIAVNNSGLRELKSIGVKFETGTGKNKTVVSDKVIETVISTGQDSFVRAGLPIDENTVKADYTVTVYDPDHTDTASSAAITVGEANFLIDKETYDISGHEIITATVTNNGLAAGSGQLIFYDVNDPDEILETYDFGKLEPDEVMNYSFRPDERGLLFNSLRIGMRVVDSAGNTLSDERQSQLWRNAVLPVSGVMLTTHKAELENVGDTLQLDAVVKPASAAEGAVLKWSSSNPDCISVDESGKVTYVRPGRATITVFSEDDKYYDECLVYSGTEDIATCTVKGMQTRFKAQDSSLEKGIKPSFTVMSGKEKLVAGTDYDYEYTDNTSIGDGHLVITGKGHYTGQLVKVFKIKSSYAYDEPDLTSIEFDKHEMTLITDTDEDSGQINATLTPSDAGDPYIYWTSSDESVATVGGSSEYTYVNAVGEGTCTITARTRDGNLTDTCEVTVKKRVYASDLEIQPAGDIVMMSDGDRYFRVNVLPEDTYDKEFSVKVSDENLAEVYGVYNVNDKKERFHLEGLGKKGEVTVTVSTGQNDEISRSFKVRLVDDENELPKYPDSIQDVYVGDNNVSFAPYSYEVDDLTRTSSDESVLAPNEDGTFTALKPGSAVLTATGHNDGKEFTVKCYVKVTISDEPIYSVTIENASGDEDFVYVGGKLQLETDTLPHIPRNKKMIWSSSDESVATIDENGLVTGISPGTATIKAAAVDHVYYYDEVSDTFEITVKEYIPLTGVEMKETNIDIPIFTYMPLDITFEPENASEQEITWTGYDESIAGIRYDGENYLVYGQYVGETTFTGTAANGITVSFTANVITYGSVEDAEVTLSQEQFTYDGNAKKPEVTVKLNGKTLTEKKDYTIYYYNSTGPGTAYVMVYGINGYVGQAEKAYSITEKSQPLPGKTTRGDMFNLANNVKVTWKEVPGAKYYKVYREGVTDAAETRKEPVIVTDRLIGWDKDPGLTNGHAYRYRIVASLTGKGDSSGDSKQSYSKLMYRLKTVVIRSVKNTAPGKVTVKYDRSTSGDSYVLQYCERQDMVGAKTKVVLGAANTSYVIGGLKKGKTYYISIRVRKKVSGIDYYTTFGVAKKVKIEK